MQDDVCLLAKPRRETMESRIVRKNESMNHNLTLSVSITDSVCKWTSSRSDQKNQELRTVSLLPSNFIIKWYSWVDKLYPLVVKGHGTQQGLSVHPAYTFYGSLTCVSYRGHEQCVCSQRELNSGFYSDLWAAPEQMYFDSIFHYSHRPGWSGHLFREQAYEYFHLFSVLSNYKLSTSGKRN